MRASAWSTNRFLASALFLLIPLLFGQACHPSSADRNTRPRGTSEVIVFSSQGDIHLINADGTGERNLTPGSIGSGDTTPSWSPDGHRIIFHRSLLEGDSLYIMNQDGTSLRRLNLKPNLDAFGPAWSPDGKSIAVGDALPHGAGLTSSGTFGDVYLVDPDGGGAVRLVHTMPGAASYIVSGSPSWSPDGTKIVYRVLDLDHALGIGYVMNADGSGVRKLAKNLDDPAWSPDGSLIAFSRKLGERFGLFVINAGGSGTTRLTKTLFPRPLNPAWSPDGMRIAFDGGGDLYVMNADGTNLMRLTADGLASDPAWKPAA